ncbi:MAG: phosphoribosylanthranilate isomerase [Nitrososphaerota archaeon]|nr:phosphoribosylanthranilate isomerase [Aigarchaeota archaeon]MDW8076390.1 phosphoribosylanthranilate isomerase [Nitrososphaerota archaeon]
MKYVRVKICGITREQDLISAVDAGADAVGFVVASPLSPRNLTYERARELIEKVPMFVDSVVVTVTSDVNELIRICNLLRPSALQIHSNNFSGVEKLRNALPGIRLIKAINVREVSDITPLKHLINEFDALLLDSLVGGYGGQGKVHDWEISRMIIEYLYPKPAILAGGLTPENVVDAVRSVKPYAVDVSSGVEKSPGIKDREKIFEFVKNARRC